MKKLATALVCLALVGFVSPPALAGSSLPLSRGVASGRVTAAVPPAEPGASGAIIRDESCFENQLGGSEAWGWVQAERVDLPFTMQSNGKYWNDIWISPQGALSHDEGGTLAIGIDVYDTDLIRASEIYAPMLAGSSATSYWNMDDPDSPDFGQHLSPVYYGFTTYGGRQALCVTWLDAAPQIPVGPREWEVNAWYPDGGFWTQAFEFDSSRRNSFQVLLVDQSSTGVGNFDIVYNYDTVQWQAEQNAIDQTTGDLLSPRYAEAGWSLGIPSYDSSFAWRGDVDGRRDPSGALNVDPQLPYPQDYWWSQHSDPHGTTSGRETYLDSSPTGLAVTKTTNTSQVGRHVFPIRGPRWHLALVLDGRASLTPEEYAAEIEAVAAGLGDEAAFPHDDGRFGISVTVTGRYLDPDTYEYVDALTVIPEMTIYSEATIATLQAWIRTIPQATGAGGSDLDGLTAAVTGNESFQTRNALRSVCQVSFAQPSAGLGSELESLRAAGAVDRVDLIGVGGHLGENTGSSMSEYYIEDLLFGGNRYMYAPSTAELADEWVGHCAERFPLIRGMEVNQAVQNLENEVPLVAGRHTVVRVYAEKVFTDDPDWALSGTLSAWDRDQGDLAWYGLPPANTDPLYLGMQFSSKVTRLNYGTNRVLEFRIDPEYAQGNLILSFDSNQPNPDLPVLTTGRTGVTCTWATANPLAPCDVEANFLEADPFYLDFYVIEQGGTAPTDDDVTEQAARVYSQMPVAFDGYHARVVDGLRVPASLSTNQLVALLFVLRTADTAFSRDPKPYFHGLLKDSGRGGVAKTGYAVSLGDIDDGWGEHVAEGTGPARNRAVHEIGHAIGLRHNRADPVDASGKGYCHEKWETGVAGEPAGVDLYWDHFRIFPADVEPSGYVRIPTISDFARRSGDAGALSLTPATVYSEFWGADFRYSASSKSSLANSDPSVTGEIMSYANKNQAADSSNPECQIDSDRTGQGRWVSPESYVYFLSRFSPDAVDVPTDGRIVMGEITSDTQGTTVEFRPVLEVPNMGTGRTNSDDVVVDLYDSEGTLLGTVTPDIAVTANEEGAGDGSESASFVASFEQEGVSRIDLVRSGVVLGSTSASASTPVVNISGPIEGSSITGDQALVEWTASDADGDPLEFRVMYSADGLDWNTLEMGVTGTSVAIDRSRIAGSASGQFMVIADDGFNSSSDIVGGLAITGNAPWVAISSPAVGEEYEASQELLFLGWASDLEDGSLAPSGIVWESSLDGVIDVAHGVWASDLTAGLHVITATVTDSEGNTATDSSTITILADEPSVPATPVAHPVSGSGASVPGPSASVGPRPSPSSGADETPGVEPSPTPSPSATASDPREPSSSAWVWLIGLVLLVSAAAVGGLWYRQRLTREP